jgi:MoxR-like ATPase
MDDFLRDLANHERYSPPEPVRVPRAERAAQHNPNGYLPDPGLADAIRVCLLLRKPLLLTGEAGTGKTDLASYLSWKLGHRSGPLVFPAKATSTGTDLFYRYDTLARFRAAQAGVQTSDKDFLTFNALGEAKLLANPPAAVQPLLPLGFEHGQQRQSVVLIDEIDKAPRDFPNDILSELDRMFFTIPELGGARVETREGWEPVVVITERYLIGTHSKCSAREQDSTGHLAPPYSNRFSLR